MTTITPNKTPDIEVIAHQAATHPTTIIGSAIQTLTKRAVVIAMFHGYVEAVADTNPGKFKVQIRHNPGDGSVNKHWITVAEFVVKGTTPDTEALGGTEAIGSTSLGVASTTGFVAEDLLYIQDTGVVTDGEWNECKNIVTNVSIELIDGLTTAKDSADIVWNDASKFVCALDLNALESFRVIWSHEGTTGANGHVAVYCSFYDSDNIA